MTRRGELVSAVLPIHGRPHLLACAAGSVLAETYADPELLIVDDASSNDTATLVERLGDPRVRYHRLERRSGAPAARKRTPLARANVHVSLAVLAARERRVRRCAILRDRTHSLSPGRGPPRDPGT